MKFIVAIGLVKGGCSPIAIHNGHFGVIKADYETLVVNDFVVINVGQFGGAWSIAYIRSLPSIDVSAE